MNKKKYFHSSSFDLNLTDATFDLNYLALNVGGHITVGGDAITQESITIGAGGAITITNDPVDFAGNGTIGWVSVAGSSQWEKVTFVGRSATLTGATEGAMACVRYFSYNANMREFIVPSAIIPSEVYAILTAPLFSADSENVSTSSKVADLVNMPCL